MIEEDYTNKRIVAVSLKISLHKDIMYLISCTRCTIELIDEYTSTTDWQFRNRTCGVMVSMLVSSAVDRGFGPRLGQIKDYMEIGICCSFAKHVTLMSKSRDWLARNQDNVSDRSSTHGLLFQCCEVAI